MEGIGRSRALLRLVADRATARHKTRYQGAATICLRNAATICLRNAAKVCPEPNPDDDVQLDSLSVGGLDGPPPPCQPRLLFLFLFLFHTLAGCRLIVLDVPQASARPRTQATQSLGAIAISILAFPN